MLRVGFKKCINYYYLCQTNQDILNLRDRHHKTYTQKRYYLDHSQCTHAAIYRLYQPIFNVYGTETTMLTKRLTNATDTSVGAIYRFSLSMPSPHQAGFFDFFVDISSIRIHF